MSVTVGWSRKYAIRNEWLAAASSLSGQNDNYDADAPGFVDIVEIANGTSEYVTYCIAQGWLSTVAEEQQKANFVLRGYMNGLHVGDTDGGDHVRGILLSEPLEIAYAEQQHFAGGLSHPCRYRRIYGRGTDARDIWFVGIDPSDLRTVR